MDEKKKKGATKPRSDSNESRKRREEDYQSGSTSYRDSYDAA